ncbi:MAG: hydantoinase/oxoprolinase family protein [Ferrovibrionaceae bacterium]|jgi:N-methylhydantoinase A
MGSMQAGLGRARIGVDIGGTFTDIVLRDATGAVHVAKVSSTPADPGAAVVSGIRALLDDLGMAPAEVGEIVHGTTVGSNTILQKVGARTGVLTTRGFRDVLEIGRIRTPTMFDLTWEKPEPLAARRHRLEVDERMAADGSVVRPLSRADVMAAGERFVAEGIEAVAICFLNSHANPAHEQAARDMLRAAFPQLLIAASCDVLPEIKEYERTSTTVVNAYLLPAMQTYIDRLRANLKAAAVEAPLQVMASNGGMMGAALAARKPVFAVASGPAGGVTGAARLGAAAAEPDLIVFDMGGTTAKASIIDGGLPSLTSEYEFRDGISAPSRFIKGGGYMLKVPAIDIAEVGAGGGSIAAIDAGGLLAIGPQSAGADPGPACYGRGNDRPTVTDANVVLGYLNPAGLAGGSLRIDPDLSAEAIRRHVAEPLGLSVHDAAHGIRQVANVNMARAIRSVTIERGRDPRDLTMMAFGGGGPLHAADVARLLGVRRVIAPVMSGLFSAVGMLAADVEHSFVRAVLRPLRSCAPDELAGIVGDLVREGDAVLAAEGYAPDARRFDLAADLRYLGQSSELTVPFTARAPAAADIAALIDGFQAEYLATFGYSNDEPLELVNIRLTARGLSADRLDFTALRLDARAVAGATGERAVSFDRGVGPVATRLMARGDVGADRLAGPLVIESYDTTILVPPGATVHADRIGNLIIDLA